MGTSVHSDIPALSRSWHVAVPRREQERRNRQLTGGYPYCFDSMDGIRKGGPHAAKSGRWRQALYRKLHEQPRPFVHRLGIDKDICPARRTSWWLLTAWCALEEWTSPLRRVAREKEQVVDPFTTAYSLIASGKPPPRQTPERFRETVVYAKALPATRAGGGSRHMEYLSQPLAALGPFPTHAR